MRRGNRGGGHSHAHGHNHGGKTKQDKVDNESYYNTLGVPKTASDADIKKAYRQLARDLHPDKNNGETVEKVENRI
jgi:DnaJ-domain-containing protein 1